MRVHRPFFLSGKVTFSPILVETTKKYLHIIRRNKMILERMRNLSVLSTTFFKQYENCRVGKKVVYTANMTEIGQIVL